MKVKDLLKGIDFELLTGTLDFDISKIEYNSRSINLGDAFFCIKGFKANGHKFAQSAIENGAKLVVVEEEIDIVSREEITVIKVKDSRKALAIAASNYYGNPSEKLKVIGITGTNGKTTSTYMIKSILEESGYKVGIIGTIANYIGDRRMDSERTTPESLELHKLFNDMVNEGVEYCVMEVSSHSLSLDRVYGITFRAGIFTNLTQDHLDFHKTFENYYEAKLNLFKNSNSIIVNIDDSYGERIIGDIKKCKKVTSYTYSIDKESDIKAFEIDSYSKGIDFKLKYNENQYNFEVNLPGKYNVYNALGVIGCCLNEGISIDHIIKGLKNVLVPGRCEIVTKNIDLGFDIILDYAHTPDGLENILKTAREFTEGRLISVYGCGGDRDATKRPIMGRIGSELSDIAIITSDNPRTEEPYSIIEDILKGIEKENYVVIENRRKAIEQAIKIAKEKDVIVIAGKGHETYQILKDEVIHFDEREVIRDILADMI